MAATKTRAKASEATGDSGASGDGKEVFYSADKTLMTLLSDDLLGASEERYPPLAREFRAALAPRDEHEAIHVQLILMALSMLRQATAALAQTPLGDMPLGRAHSQAYRMLTQLLKEYRKLQGRKLGAADDEAEDDPSWSSPPPPPEGGDVPIEPLPEWRERIEFPDVPGDGPESWPIVRGTSLRAEHVMALIEEGWPASRILWAYPQLRHDDLRACKGCDIEGLCGPPPA